MTALGGIQANEHVPKMADAATATALEAKTLAEIATIAAPNSGNTASRPTLTAGDVGYAYFDTDLGHPIWWTGTTWVDSNGAAA